MTVRPELPSSSIRPEAAPLELRVADREHLVHEQDLRLQVRRDGEREPHVHPARVALDGRVHEALDAGEVDDRVEALLDLAALHAEDRAVQVDVLAARELGMEAGPDLEQAAHAAADLDAAARGRRDPRQHLEERRLARAVPTDDSEHLALLDVERDVPERPDLLCLGRVLAPREPAADVCERLPERPVGRLVLSEHVLLREALERR